MPYFHQAREAGGPPWLWVKGRTRSLDQSTSTALTREVSLGDPSGAAEVAGARVGAAVAGAAGVAVAVAADRMACLVGIVGSLIRL